MFSKPMGRPTNWSLELEAEAYKYLETWQEEHGHAFPSVVGLCEVIKRSRANVYEWAKHEDKNFSDILNRINQLQELVVWNKSMKGEYNSTMSKLLLTKHGYSDKVDATTNNTHQGPDGGPIQTQSTITFVGVGPDYQEGDENG